MRTRGLKELVKRERPRHLPPLYDIEQWFEETWKKPFSMFGRSVWPELGVDELYEVSPNVDLFQQGNEIVLNVDLPGVKKDDMKIDLSENILTLTGEKKRKEEINKEDYYRYERLFGSFVRRFELPGNLDTDKIKAHFEDGVLEIRIPMMKESEKAHRKISIE